MMKKILITIVTLALCGGVAFSQGITDAYKYSQTDLTGTARYLGMAGAFGALGGDISAMKGNPAGLGVYRSSEVVASLSLNMVNAQSNWIGTKQDMNRTYVSFDNIAYVGYFPTGNSDGLVSWTAGFSYNRLKNFRRNYKMTTGSGMPNSLTDYVAVRATGLEESDIAETRTYDPYDNPNNNDWLSILGYNAGYMTTIEGSTNVYQRRFMGEGGRDAIDMASLEVHESGAIDQYDISFGLNFSDVFMLGGTLTVTDINYDYESLYDELFEYNLNDLFLDNGLSTDGTGYGFNLGAILRAGDYLRFGVAYNSPTWYKLTDYYYGEAGTSYTYMDGREEVQVPMDANTPADGAYSDYEFRSPDKWLFSAAAILGQSALVSVDYELTNYRSMHLSDRYGSIVDKNDDIKAGYGMGNTLRVGAEVKVTPQFAIRAGGAWSSTPLKTSLKNGTQEVFTVGTIPNYTLDKGSANYTIGLGYRFTPNFYTDLACVFTNFKEDAYAFSPMVDELGVFLDSTPATLKTRTTRVALTFGYKF